MIETKLLAGRFLDFTRPTWRNLTGAAPVFAPVVCPPLNLQESVRRIPGAALNPFRNVGGQRASGVAAGTATAADKLHRNFKFLPWYQGDISETTLDRDVITGPMSGCVLVSYRQGGNVMVGHIGTVTVTDAVPATINTNVKALWNNFANANPLDVIGGFNPVAVTVPMHPPAQAGDVGGETWGLYTVGGDYYAVEVYKQAVRPGGPVSEFRVAAIHRVPTMTLVQLQNL